MIEKTVMPLHFEDRSGTEFERLSFAYLMRTGKWKTLDWYGQLGGDRGRDIWGVLNDATGTRKVLYQCANHRRLSFKKADEDLKKIIGGPYGIPNEFILIAGGKVSAEMKQRVCNHALSLGIGTAQVWSGPEFEERLRKDTPDLIKRFSQGEEFPESPQALTLFAMDSSTLSDSDIIKLLAECFDRPAFTTPFMQESSLPDFKKAITDTIEALNTGVRRLREGTVIRQIPSRHDIQNDETRKTLAAIVGLLTDLRAQFDSFLRSGGIRHCACGDPACPVYMVQPQAGQKMDEIRNEILNLVRSILPGFHVRMR